MTSFEQSPGPPRRSTWQLFWSWAPYISVLIVAVVFFGLGFLKSSDHWKPISLFLDQVVGANLWQVQSHFYDSKTGNLIVNQLTLADGRVLGLRGQVSIDKLEISVPEIKENLARTKFLKASGLTNTIIGSGFSGDLKLDYFELEELSLTWLGRSLIISADRGTVKNLSTAWQYNSSSNQPRKLEISLARLDFNGGVGIDQAGRLSFSQGEIDNLVMIVGSQDHPAELNLTSLKVSSHREMGRSEKVELNGFSYRYPLTGSVSPWTPSNLNLGSMKVQSLDLGPIIQRLSYLSLIELSEMWLTNLTETSWPEFSADLLLSRPLAASMAELADLSITFGHAQSQEKILAAKALTFAPLARFNLKARLDGLTLVLGTQTDSLDELKSAHLDSNADNLIALNLDQEVISESEQSRSTPGNDSQTKTSVRTSWIELFKEAGLDQLSADLEIDSVFEPSEQTYVLEVTKLKISELMTGQLRLKLADLDQSSLVSLSHLNPGNIIEPMMESGLHHSNLVNLSVEFDDNGLIEKLISASGPKAQGPVKVLDKSQRLSDLFEMALTIRFDNLIENVSQISDLFRSFLTSPNRISVSVNPDQTLSPGEVRFTRDLPGLLNSMNLAMTLDDQPPLKVIFRTDPAGFDRNYTGDDYGLYPGETRP